MVGAVAVVAVAGAGVGFATQGSTSSSGHAAHGGQSAGSKGVSPATLKAELASAVSITPANGATGVAPGSPITVTTKRGRLTSVQVTSSTGTPLAGLLDATGTHWISGTPTAPSSHYQINTVVSGGGGVSSSSSSSFSTVTATAVVGATLWPTSGLSVGVGQPVVLKFDQPISDPAAQQSVLAHLHVTLSTPVPVGAHWFSTTELHLRPETVWPSGEQITVTDALDGWNAGGGMWGEGSSSVRFSIGDARVSTANLATHQMTVTDNGQTVATYPISAGSDQYPTMDGIHIVLDRSSVVQMNSATVGIPAGSPGSYDETVYWDVHVSDSGEYVHAAPWSVSAQGNTNVSHGCVNLSPADAQQFFGFSRIGDLVEVIGGPRPPVAGDHGVMDWQTDWSAWTPITVT